MFDGFLFVIPARAGSAGVPRKNLQLLGSDPLFMHSVKAAVNDGIDKRNILVSSNDPTVLEIADKYGVVAHLRPDALCTGESPTELALLDAVQSRQDCHAVVTLQPTSPIRFPGLIEKCVTAYTSGEYDSLLTTTKFYNFFWYEKKNKHRTYEWRSTYKPSERPMRQALTREEHIYFDNGNLYISDIEMLTRTKCRIGENVYLYPVTEAEGMQIDTPADLATFRMLYKGLSNG